MERQPQELLTSRDAGALIGVTFTTILRWGRSGRLKVYATTPTKIQLFRREDVLEAKAREPKAA